MNVATPEPWSCALAPIGAREIPDDIAERFRLRPDVVEELSDGLRLRGIESSIDLSGYVTNREDFIHAGPVLTVRYAPKRFCDNEQRLGHGQIGAAAIPGCVIPLRMPAAATAACSAGTPQRRFAAAARRVLHILS